ncbi:uncharacterized protein LOC141585210 [Saimiri boliviensis]|uniref:uncharacterized protein LOC141585210 n=1 Tax=Saimiri boliviensis TaxID=27679 RepID=UPI003D777A94
MRHGGQGQPWGFRSQKALRRLLPLPPPPPSSSLPQPPPQPPPPPPPLPGRERGGAGPPPSGQRRANWRGCSAHAGARLPLPHNPPLIPKRTNTPRGPPRPPRKDLRLFSGHWWPIPALLGEGPLPKPQSVAGARNARSGRGQPRRMKVATCSAPPQKLPGPGETIWSNAPTYPHFHRGNGGLEQRSSLTKDLSLPHQSSHNRPCDKFLLKLWLPT